MDLGKKIKKIMKEGSNKIQATAIALEMKKRAAKKKLKKNRKIASLGVRG